MRSSGVKTNNNMKKTHILSPKINSCVNAFNRVKKSINNMNKKILFKTNNSELI